MRRLLVLLAVVLAAALATPSASGYEVGTELFRFRDAQITESSGVSASSFRDDLFFTHNDSGDRARFFAIDRQGCTLVRFNLTGVEAIDWEDMARGPAGDGAPSLFFGDVGDNLHQRTGGISVYQVAEPQVTAVSTPASAACPTPTEQTIGHVRFDLRFEDVPHDVETLLVHPLTGQLFLVTKTYWNETALYAAPNPLLADTVNVLERVAQVLIPPTATVGGNEIATAGRFATTAGEIAPDADRLVIRTYTDAWEWTVPDGDVVAAFASLPTKVDLPPTNQGEAIAYTRDGRSLVVTTEGAEAPVHLIRG